MTEEVKCEECRFARPFGKHSFQCVRQSPRLVEGMLNENLGPRAVWPVVLDSDWCGEWEKQGGCPHDRLDEDGICRACGEDRRGGN